MYVPGCKFSSIKLHSFCSAGTVSISESSLYTSKYKFSLTGRVVISLITPPVGGRFPKSSPVVNVLGSLSTVLVPSFAETFQLYIMLKFKF